MTQHVVSFSGGKDSTALLLMMIERGMQIDRIVNIDTTKEFPQMYEHIAKASTMIAPLEIETLAIDYDYWFSEHVKTKGKRKGERGYGWADFRNRWCTALKRLLFQRCVYGDGKHEPRQRGRTARIHTDIIEYHGIAYDERERTERNNDGRDIRYPLVDWGITEAMALQYCYDRGLDWGGLYEHFPRLSCWCCPLKRIGELENLYRYYPDLWAELRRMDALQTRKFKPTYTVAQLDEKFSSHQIAY